ncbi:MAG: type I DNA topoisomerase [Planctomycetota bacterium]
MGKNLVIVESPAKAKTINKFLGKDFVVEASMGHIRDLPKRKLGIDVENGFAPQYQTIRGRGKVLAKLRKLAERADIVYLAPDLDREGEAIAWHLMHALELPKGKFMRITFNEITEKAIKSGIKNAGAINMDKVNAQQARRLLDRLVGYRLSPLLWSKLAKGLSAGRVQSVAVRMIVDRDREIEKFKSEEYWTVSAQMAPQGTKTAFESQLVKLHGRELRRGAEQAEISLQNEEEAHKAVAALKGKSAKIGSVEKKKRQENARPPFTTSTLQQACSIRFNFSAKKTMMLAQQLYEGVSLGGEGSVGLITYMRTDSVRLSDEAIEECREHVLNTYGKEFLPEKPNKYRAKKAAQEAHEAIRPSTIRRRPEDLKAYLSADQMKLYTLIWRRTVSSQMAPAQIAQTSVDIAIGDSTFRTNGREILFPGFRKLEGADLDEEAGSILPELNEGQDLDVLSIDPLQHFTSPPPRFNEASLVKELEKEGIGRPSTYAPTISTIEDRGYVKRQDRKFLSTELGRLVTDLLVEHFPNVVDKAFTSEIENRLDSIEEEGTDWVSILRDFYGPFSADIEKAEKNMVNYKKTGTQTDQVCQLCGKPMLLLWSRRGQFLGCSGFPDCRNSRPWGEDAGADQSHLAVDQPPCELCKAPMVVKEGKFGRFMSCSKYPECKHTRQMPTGIPCPQEGCTGQLTQRRSKKGRPFYGCTRYPECDYITNRLQTPPAVDATADPLAKPE